MDSWPTARTRRGEKVLEEPDLTPGERALCKAATVGCPTDAADVLACGLVEKDRPCPSE